MILGLLASRSLFYQSLKVIIMSLLGSLYTITILQSQSLALMSYIMSSPKHCFYYSSLLPNIIMISLVQYTRTRAILSIKVFRLVLFLRMSIYKVLTSISLSASPYIILVRPLSQVLIVQMSSILSLYRDPDFKVRAASLIYSYMFYNLGG